MVLLCVQKRYKILDGIALYVSGYLPTKNNGLWKSNDKHCFYNLLRNMTDSIGGMSLGKKKDLGQKFNLVATTKNVIRKKRKKNRERGVPSQSRWHSLIPFKVKTLLFLKRCFPSETNYQNQMIQFKRW